MHWLVASKRGRLAEQRVRGFVGFYAADMGSVILGDAGLVLETEKAVLFHRGLGTPVVSTTILAAMRSS